MFNSLPSDGIGNPIRKGSLVHVKLTSDHLLFQVLEIRPAQSTEPGNGSNAAVSGEMLLQAIVPVGFAPDTIMQNMLVVKDPKALVELAPSIPALVKTQ